MKYYPALLDVRGRRCIVLGAGPAAWSKIRDLRDAGAEVVVISAAVSDDVRRLAESGGVTLIERPHRRGELTGAAVVIDTTGDPRVSERARRETREARVLLNVLDRPEMCDFAAPALLRRDPLVVAVTSSGASPFLAAAVRDRIGALLGDEWGPFTSTVGAVRRNLRRRGIPANRQNVVYRRLLASPVRDLIRDGKLDEAIAAADAITAAGGEGPGRVALVGAGPGDPGLLTLAALDLLVGAEVVFHDALIDPRTLRFCRSNTRLVDVGKRGGRDDNPEQSVISDAMIEAARQGLQVVRLKGGDPFVFGRGGEEVDALLAAGIDVLVVPGITSVVAAPAAAGIPLTLRGVSSSVAFTTAASSADSRVVARLQALASVVDTLVVLMPLANLEDLVAQLVTVLGDRPAALVSAATTPDEHTVFAPLASLATAARRAEARAPATLVIGDVVAHACGYPRSELHPPRRPAAADPAATV